MTVFSTPHSEKDDRKELKTSIEDNTILCNHCKRTASNGIKCKGICVSDSDY